MTQIFIVIAVILLALIFSRNFICELLTGHALASMVCRGQYRPSQTTTKGGSMKQDVVTQGLTDLQAAETQAQTDFLGGFYDKVVADQPAPIVPSGGGFSQSDLDNAVAQAVAPLNQQISDLTAKDATDMQAAVDAKAAGDAAVASIQSQLDTISAAKTVEDGIISGLQTSLATIQGVVTALASLQTSAPAPAPVDPSQSPSA